MGSENNNGMKNGMNDGMNEGMEMFANYTNDKLN